MAHDIVKGDVRAGSELGGEKEHGAGYGGEKRSHLVLQAPVLRPLEVEEPNDVQFDKRSVEHALSGQAAIVTTYGALTVGHLTGHILSEENVEQKM